MPSRIRHVVQPLTGWLFVLVVAIALGAALLYATRPMVEVTSRGPALQMH